MSVIYLREADPFVISSDPAVISDRLLDLVRILTLTDEEKVERLPTMYPEHEDAYRASGAEVSYGQWLFEQLTRTKYTNRDEARRALIPVSAVPSWRFLQYVDVVEDDRWLLHLTDEATFYRMQHVGFSSGILDPALLGFTLDSDADRGRAGYHFAYDATGEEWQKRLDTADSILGGHIVMFKAPGVVVSYTGTRPERFVVFEGPAAHSFAFIDPLMVPGRYSVATVVEYDEDCAFASESLAEVVQWVRDHYAEFEDVLIQPDRRGAES